MRTMILITVLVGISSCIWAQSGEIRGKVFDENGNPLYGANVNVIGGVSNSGTSANFDGEFIVKPLNAGLYTVEVSFIGYATTQVVGVNVFNNRITFIDDVHLRLDVIIGGSIDIVVPRENLINRDEPQKVAISGDKIIRMPGAKNPAMIARDLQSDIQVENNQMIVRGSRAGASAVFVDGVKGMDETSKVPSLIIGSVEVYSGGIPAKYGDVTGGVVIVTTKSYFDLVNERRAKESSY